MDWKESLINAKYHLSVARRMYDGYGKFADKRFLIGVINETARAAGDLIRAFFDYENVEKRSLGIFMDEIAPKYLDDLTRENLFKILEVERAQKTSPIEYAKGDKIILLIEGKYRFLRSERVGEFLGSVEGAIGKFPRK